MLIQNLADFYYHQLNHAPQKDAFTQKENGEWTPVAIDAFIEKSKLISAGLLELGLVKGDRIAVIANNRVEWHLMDLAIQQIGMVNVPIYANINDEDYIYILNDCGAKMVLVSDERLLKKMQQIKPKVASVEHVFSFDFVNEESHYMQLVAQANKSKEIPFEALRSEVKSDDLATLIYTSGTTGNPKGVMLTHMNLISNVLASEDRLPLDSSCRALSFLPLCHVFERMLDYLYIYRGVSIYYAESLDTIGDNLKEVCPQMFATVPRLLEKVYDKIVMKGEALTGIKKKLFFWALDLGLKYDPSEDAGLWYNIQLKLANKIIFNKWREALGNKIMLIVSGGAALQPRLSRIFTAAQIPILEGYGLTETSPVISVNCLKRGIKVGTVGAPLENLDVKIAEDGEIIVKGPSIMKGYYNCPDLTKEAIDEQGYFHTGDIGEIVNNEYLKITDRKKEIFKTSGGKYVAPQVMENKFKESRFIEQIMVIGEGQKHPAALVQPDFIFLKEWCDQESITWSNNQEMIRNEKVLGALKKEINQINQGFSNYERVKKFELLDKPWSIEGGELTPTLKLKRKNIKKKYEAIIQKIYDAAS